MATPTTSPVSVTPALVTPGPVTPTPVTAERATPVPATKTHTMKLVAIESTMLQAVSYDEQNETLLVLFNSGKAYRYFAVPKSVYVGLLEADSKGRYLRQEILNRYSWEFARKPQRKTA